MSNNYEGATDEFCYAYKRYKRTMPWKDFKRAGYIRGQVLCEKYDWIVTGHYTRSEKFWYLIDKLIAYIRKGKKTKGKKKKMKLFSSKSSGKKVDIFPSKREVGNIFPKGNNKVRISYHQQFSRSATFV